MNRAAVVVTLLTAVALAALWLFAWPRPEEPAADPFAPTGSAVPAPGDAPHVPAEPAASQPPASQPAVTRTAAAPVATTPTAPGTTGPRLRVIDGKDGAVVPGAVVWIVSRSGADADLRVPAAGDDPLAPLRGRAPIVTDAGGEAIGAGLPAPGQVLVAASDAVESAQAGRLGWRTLDGGAITASEVIEITIDARSALTLRVLAAGGAPCADVPLRISAPLTGSLWPLWRGASGADGTVRVTDLVARGRASARVRSMDALPVIAYVDAPLGTRPRAEFDLTAPPPDGVELLLPPTGSLRVELDTSGVAPVHGGSVTVQELDATEDERRFASHDATPLRDRSARFPVVGLGLRLRVSVRIAGASEPRIATVTGPVRPGEERHVLVPARSETSEIVVRLLDPEGKPLADEMFALELEARVGGSSSSSSSGVKSDGSGRVRIGRADKMGDDADRTLELRHAGLDLSLAIPVPKPWPAGETDLGDRRMEAPPLLVAGIVVDHEDRGIADAHIEIDEIGDVRVRTSQDGRFTVRTRTPVTSATLRVTAHAFVPSEAIPIVPGTAGVRVRLAAAGILQGELLLDPLGTKITLFVAVRERHAEQELREQVRGDSFVFAELRAGVYAVTVHVAGVAQPVARADDVVVTAGQTTSLPAFDLRGHLRRITFQVVDENGAALPEAEALMTADVGVDGPRFDGVLLRDGRGTVVSTRAQVDLVVFASGRRTVFVSGIQDGQQVVLGRPATVSVRVPPAALPPAPCFLLVTIEPHDERFPVRARYTLRGDNSVTSSTGILPWAGGQSAIVDASGHAAVAVGTTGPHHIRCHVMRRGGADGGRVLVEGTSPRMVTLVEDGAVPPVQLDLPAEAVERARQRL